MYPAPCSWRVVMKRSASRRCASASLKSYMCAPGIPNTVSTPCAMSDSAIARPVVMTVIAAALLGLDEFVADGDQGELGLILDAELLLDVVQMSADGRGRELEILGDALHRRAAREPHEHLEL